MKTIRGVPYPLPLLTVKPIPQSEADKYLKKAYWALPETRPPAGEHEITREDLRHAFQDELRDLNKSVWALPDIQPPVEPEAPIRVYFLVSSPEGPELLASINAKLKNSISSFAKIVPDQLSRARGRDCVRRFIEGTVVPLCYDEEHVAASVMTYAKRAEKVLLHLSKPGELPRGIQQIERGTYTFTLYLDPVEPAARGN